MIWHSESLAAVLGELKTDRDAGLASEDAAARLRETGKNIVDKSTVVTFPQQLARMLKRPSVWILLLVSAVTFGVAWYQTLTSYIPGDRITPLAVAVLAVVRAVLVAFRKWRAERALPSMKALASPIVHVRRDGVQATVSAATLVPGDIVELNAGDLIPADCRLIDSFELHCDESSLTGDPLPVEKNAEEQVRSITPFSQRKNMLYAGCTIVRGKALAVVTDTASHTEAGKHTILREASKDAALPMQNSVVHLGEKLAAPVLFGGVVTALVAIVMEQPILTALMLGFALAVAILPEEIPALAPSVITVAIRKMAATGAVVSRPSVVEELGRTAVLCTNKTGSFTQNTMTLVRAFSGDRMVKLDQNRPPDDLHSLIQLTALCSNRIPTPTEQAVLDYAQQHGTDLRDLSASYPRLGEIPFDPDRRRMTAVHLVEGRNIVIVKGAPEVVLPLCGDLPEGVADAEAFMSAEALRVLAVAYKTVMEAPTDCYAEELETDLCFLGLLGLNDPLHPELPATLDDCRRAGLKTVLFTNESVLTAAAAARRAGLLTDRNQAVCGHDLEGLTDEEFAAVANRCVVYARISPQDQQRLVRLWQTQGQPVIVTGDGPEDVPALREAEISCAMARNGADVAAATADMVLTDDRYSTLVNTVRAGRTTFVNLRKTVGIRLAHLLSMLLATLFGLLVFGQAPLAPLCLLWVGVVSSLVLTPALGREVPQRDVMRQPPRRRNERLFAHGVISLSLAGVLLAILTSVAQKVVGLTGAFAVLTLGQSVLLLVARSTHPVPFTKLFYAPWAWFALVTSAVLFMFPLFTPGLLSLLGLAPLTAEGWRAVGILLGVLWVVTEIYKWVRLLLLVAWRQKESR